MADNDDATWLLGDASPEPSGSSDAAPTNDLERARARRQASGGVLGEQELPLGDDAISLVRGEEAVGAEQPVEAFLDTAPEPVEEPEPDSTQAGDAAAELDAAEQGQTESSEDPSGEERDQPTRRKPAKKRGRASVPSWDEIMFGSGQD